MEKWKKLRRKIFFLSISIILFIVVVVTFPRTFRAPPTPNQKLHRVSNSCPERVSNQIINPLRNTKHFLMSAYIDQRVKNFDIRVMGIFKRDSIQPLYCLFCCAGQLGKTTALAKIKKHPENFGFPYVVTNVLCQIPQKCNVSHVSVQTRPERVKISSQIWFPTRNQWMERGMEQFDFTVCIANLFEANSVLQYAQSLELYRLLGVDRVVIYNTSCGPDLDRLLQSYSKEGFVEMVPWPINQYLDPSRSWQFSQHERSMHYFDELATLNECIYRSMDRSRYVLLHDINEIIMPYQHSSLAPLMDLLQQQHPNAGVFLVEQHVHPRNPFETNKMSKWQRSPGFNILEHIYKLEPNRTSESHPYRLIVKPRMVVQTSVHSVIETFGEQYKIPPELCHIIHTPVSNVTGHPLQTAQLDTRLWDFNEQLIQNVNEALKRAGLVRTARGEAN